MYIEEIIIDGFKSYAKPTRLVKFDPHFNAITGLNGTGKSNILDAICFVLGISNLSQVRAGSLQELVYKQGQAGVERAVVTLVFNNMDKRGSPIGKEDRDRIEVTREVAIGSKNKYRVDGRVCQQSEVQNLFHSVQLNVNNPHFLIMQGRITKVLNMKPAEILGMIEEAAGTRMFETKKQAAIKTIDKKQAKVVEINSILSKEITPTLERLRGEKVQYVKWSANNTEVQRLERFCQAHIFCEEERKVKEQEEEARKGVERERELNAQIGELKAAVKGKEAEASALEAKRDGRAGPGRALKTALAAEDECSKALVKATSEWQNKKAALQQDTTALTALEESEAEAAAALAAKKNDQVSAGEAALAATAAATAAEEEQVTLQSEYQGACAGVGSGKEETRSLAEQEAAADAAAGAADATAKQAAMRAKHLESKAKALEKEARAAAGEGAGLRKEHEKAVAAAAEAEAELQGMKYDAAGEAALRAEAEAAEADAAALGEAAARLRAQLEGRLRFDYSDPVKNFDRSSVKGLVAQIITLKDAAMATALEVTAGGKLYQVVVDNEKTGKLLLQRGKLRRRVTIIPLSSIARGGIEPQRLNRAAQLAAAHGGTARAAIELVGFEGEVEAAVQHVFGTSIVCDSLNTAKQVAFHKDVRARCVTLEGDSFEPGGTLTGGSRAQLGSVLTKLRELADVQEKLGRQRAAAAAASARLEGNAAAAKRFAELSRRVELKRHEAATLAARRERGTLSQLESQLAETTAALAEARAAGAAAVAAGEKARERRGKLAAEAATFRDKREGTLRTLENRVAAAKRAAAVASEAARTSQQRMQILLREVRQLETDGAALAEQVATAKAAVAAAAAEVASSESAASACKEAHEQAKAVAAQRREEATALDSEFKALQKERRALSDEMDAATAELKKHVHGAAGAKNAAALAARRLTELTRKHSWIKEDKEFFGRPGTDYDFAARDPKEAAQRLEALKTEQHSLSRKINKKVVGMIESMESEYKELMRKREVIEKDKAKIQSVIKELDHKKDEALQSTWVKVNRDFGSIFATLLPGTSAKLEPPEGASALDGLEVKVAFGSVWKESLTELSGGQRSLLALSLILALLLFKPAPTYILDEVDAALDLSHTQNIGAMLRTHFAASQFIVVSLKEGMFNNANVIYRTRFIEGVSAVQRTVNTNAGGGGNGGRAVLASGGGDKARAAKRGKRAEGSENEDAVAAA